MAPTGEHGGALGLGVLDVLGDRPQLRLVDERAHVVAELERGAERHRLDGGDEARDELLGDVLVDDDPLGRDAQLAGAGEGGAHGPLDGLVQVGVGRDVDGVLAPELEAEAHEPRGRVLGDLAAGRRRPGVADVVGGVDDRLTGLPAGPEDDLEDPLGQARLTEQVDPGERGDRALLVRAQHDGVAGHEGGQGVGDRQAQRVVPRGDDPDDALGVVVHPGLGEHRVGAGDLARAQVPLGGAAVVAGGESRVDDLLEGLLAHLAGLDLHEVEQLDLALEDEVVEAQEDPLALLEGGRGPADLSGPRGGDGPVDVRRGRERQRRDRPAGQRRGPGEGLGRRRGHDTAGQPARPARIDRVGGGGVQLRVSDRLRGHYPTVIPASAFGHRSRPPVRRRRRREVSSAGAGRRRRRSAAAP